MVVLKAHLSYFRLVVADDGRLQDEANPEQYVANERNALPLG